MNGKVNEEDKNRSVAGQSAGGQTAQNGGAWVGDKKISGFLKLFKTPGQESALDRLSADIGAASVKPSGGKPGEFFSPEVRDIFEKTAETKAAASPQTAPTVPETPAVAETKPEEENISGEPKPEGPAAEIEIISGKEELLGTSAKTGAEANIKRLRTYKEDVAEALKREKTSVVKMVIDEQRRKEGLAPIAQTSSKKNAVFVWLGLILLILGAGTIALVYVFKKQDQTAVTLSGGKIISLVFAENEKKISITDTPADRLGKIIKLEVSSADIRLDTILNLRFTEAGAVTDSRGEPIEMDVNAGKFLGALQIDLPPVLLRSLTGEFMVGVHAWNGNQAFIILKNNFYENAFAGMLRWEETMAKDLLPVFTNRSLDSFYGRTFQDLVIKNRDIRGITDENGEPILMYIFANRETVIIATHKDTLNEAVSRLLKTTATSQ